MKLRTRSRLVVVSAFALAAAAGVVVADSVSEARDTLDRVEGIDGILEDVSDLQALTGSYAARGSDRTRIQWTAVHESLTGRLGSPVIAEAGAPEELGRLDENLASAERLFGALTELDRDRSQSAGPPSARLRSVLLSQINITLQGMADDLNRWEERVYDRMWGDFSRLGASTGAVALILVAIFGLSSMWVEGSVLGPLGRLEEGIARIGEGDRSFRFGWDRDDEIGSVAGAFDAMVSRLEEQESRQEATERELRRSEERFRQIAEYIDDVFWVTTPGKDVMEYVSPAYEDIWGRPPEDLYASARQWIEHIHPEDRERVRRALSEQVQGTYEEQYRIVRPDGEVRWIWDRAFPVRDEDGTVYRIVGVAEDVTDRRELEEQLLQSQKMEAVGRLAGGIAHDFNNLLTVIRSEADLLKMDLGEDSDLSQEIDVVRETAGRASVLTSQLLAFSRKQVMRPRIVDLDDVVRQTHGLLSRVLGEDIRIETDLDEDVPPVRIDPGQMEQVLMNLAVNARDAMLDGGTLQIATSVEEWPVDETRAGSELESGIAVRVDVADTGVGMGAETRAQIFEPFFTTKQQSGGTGLGLATVYGIVQQSQGTIDVESEPGRGTVFTLRFPPAKGEVQKLDRHPPRKVATERLTGRALVIEDDDNVREVARKILVRAGLGVRAVKDAESALEALELEEGAGIDLILTDLVLPRMSGRELVDLLQERFPEVPLVVMSGYAEGSPGSRGDLPAHIPFIQKPFTPDELVRIVAESLAGEDRGVRRP